jgi:hypothetical protein
MEKAQAIGLGNGFMDITKNTGNKSKNRQLGYPKLKSFCIVK